MTLSTNTFLSDKSRYHAAHQRFVRETIFFVSAILISLLPSVVLGQLQQQLRIVAPAPGERISPRTEFLIQWGGIPFADSVQISFSQDAGKSWQLITQAGVNWQYRWAVPSLVGDSCLLQISTKPRDLSNAVQSTAFAIRSGQRRASSKWLNRWAAFSFDGTKILSVASLPTDTSLRQLNSAEVYDASSGQRILTLPNFVIDSLLRFSSPALSQVEMQAQWSPDNNEILGVIDETSFGIYNASSGALLRRISVPREGFRTSLQYVKWTPAGDSMVARILYRMEGSGGAGTILADKSYWYAKSEMFDRPSRSTSASVVFDAFGSTYLGFLPNGTQWLSVVRPNSAERASQIVVTTLATGERRVVDAPSGYSWQSDAIITSPNSNLLAAIAIPNDNNFAPLLSVININAGIIRSAPRAQAVSFTPDSRRLLIRRDNSVIAELVDATTLQSVMTFQNLYAPSPRTPIFSTTNIISAVKTGTEALIWLNNGEKILGYENSAAASAPTVSTNAQALGLWLSETGCLAERFVVPRLRDMPVPLRFALESVQTIVANRAERQFLLTNTTTDSMLVVSVTPGSEIICQTTISSGLWSIRSPDRLQVQESFVIPTLVCETTASIRVPITNVSGAAIPLEVSVQGFNNSSTDDFSFDEGLPTMLGQRATDSLRLRFTPRGFGNSTIQIVFRDILTNSQVRTIIFARRDSVAFEPAAPVVNLGIIPARTVITTTLTVRNTGNTPIVWTTSATRTSTGTMFVTNIRPNPTPVNAVAEISIQVQPFENLGFVFDNLPLLFCGVSTATARVQARVLPEFQQLENIPSVDFGNFTCETSSRRSIRLVNVGGRTLNVNVLDLQDSIFRIVNPPRLPRQILPLDTLILNLEAIIRGNGNRQGELVIGADDSQMNLRNVGLRVQRQSPVYTWIPDTLKFDRIEIGSPAEETIEFLNNGPNPYLWSELPRALSPDFTLISAVPNPTPIGTRSRITVRFGGKSASQITATTAVFNLGDICQTFSSLRIEAITVQATPKAIVRGENVFDTLLCETDQTKNFEILNVGRSRLQIDSMYVETRFGQGRSANADFQIASSPLPSFPISIDGAGTETRVRQFAIRFRPLQNGLRENWLVIHSNDTSTSPNGIQRIRLSGVKEAASFSLTPEIVRFTNPTSFVTLWDTVTIRNTGTKPLTWENFPRRYSQLFSIERIIPPITLPGMSSRAIVRLEGISINASTNGSVTLENPLCSANATFRYTVGNAPQAALVIPSRQQARLLCSADTTLRIPVQNVGGAMLQFSEQPRFLDAIATEATVLSAPVNLAPSQSSEITVRLSKTQVPMRTFRLLVLTNDALTPRREIEIVLVNDFSQLVIMPEQLTLQNAQRNQTGTVNFSIRNLGTIPQQIATPLVGTNLVVETITPNPIPAGSAAQASVRYTISTNAIMSNVFRASVEISDSCARRSAFTLQAPLIDARLLLPDSIALAPSAELRVPVLMRPREGVGQSQTVSFRLRVANTSLVQILSPAATSEGILQNRVENGARILRISVPVQASDTLLTLRLRGLLGNDSLTTISIDSALIGGTAVRGSESRFRTLGINSAGGGRPGLYFTPALRLVAPNPASDKLSVVIDAPQEINITLQLVNLLGQAKTLYDGRIDAGLKEMNFSLTDFATGVYLLDLRSVNSLQAAQILEHSVKTVHIVR